MRKKIVTLGLAVASVFMFSTTAFAAGWRQDSVGWWYQNDDGTYPQREWKWIDGNGDGVSECYYFDSNGYCMMNNVTPEGYVVNTSGAWIVKGVVQTQVGGQTQTGKGISERQVQNIFKSFLQNKEYRKYTSEWTESPSKYAYLDIDGDGSQELILISDGVFFNSLICSADVQSGAVKILDNGYYFGSIRYSETYRALALTDFRPNSMLGGYDFMGISGSKLVSKFSLAWDATGGNEIYYKNNSKITEQEFSAYFDTLVEPSYIDLQMKE